MKYISFYNAQGRVTGAVGLEDEQLAVVEDKLGPHVPGNWYDKDVYVANGEVIPRPANPATLDGMTLRNLPHSTIVHINGTPYPCDEGYAELEFTHPGTYKVRVECWPHLDKEFTVENPA